MANDATEVELLVRDVITHLGLPFTVLSVNASPTGWNIVVRAGTGGMVRFTLVGGRPTSMRIAIQERLEAEPHGNDIWLIGSNPRLAGTTITADDYYPDTFHMIKRADNTMTIADLCDAANRCAHAFVSKANWVY